MKWGLVGMQVPQGIPYALAFNTVAYDFDLSPIVLAAIAKRESNFDAFVLSGDGGHGLMQLTASFPTAWQDPFTNITYAVDTFLAPAFAFWSDLGLAGTILLKCVAAEYNAGRSMAVRGHNEGDVDKYTTDNYGQGVVDNYLSLVAQEGEKHGT